MRAAARRQLAVMALHRLGYVFEETVAPVASCVAIAAAVASPKQAVNFGDPAANAAPQLATSRSPALPPSFAGTEN
jgi:hypothetical protein